MLAWDGRPTFEFQPLFQYLVDSTPGAVAEWLFPCPEES